MKMVQVDYKGETAAALALWQRIYKVTTFFVGASDDLTFFEYDRAIVSALGEEFKLGELADADNMAKLKKELDKLRSPEILGGFVAALLDTTEETKGWRFMGQRFAPDSYVLGRMVWNHVDPDMASEEYQAIVSSCVKNHDGECGEITIEDSNCICYAGLGVEPDNPYGVCRLMPRGLDVMAVLGSDAAVNVLESDERFCNFSDQLGGLINEFTDYTTEDWTQNAYWAWLHSLKPLLAQKGEGWPVWMTTFAWKLKQLNCAMSSWAQLRHDTILYVKQSYTPAVAGVFEPMQLEFGGYVEPVPYFYHRLAFLSEFTRKGLVELDLLPEKAETAMLSTEKLLADLREISIAELQGMDLSETQKNTIIGIGPHMTHIIEQLASAIVVEQPMDEWCEEEPQYCLAETDLAGDAFKTRLVADVHTDGNTGKVLEVATGKVDWVIVVHRVPAGQLVASIGPVFTYYEFTHPMSDRLTDEAWRSMLNQGEAPARPEWVAELY